LARRLQDAREVVLGFLSSEGERAKMSIENEGGTVVHEGTPGWVVPAIVLAAILAIVGIWIGARASSYAQDNHQAVTAVANDVQTLKQSYSKDMDSLQQRLAQAEKQNTQLEADLGTVTKRLRITQGALKTARAEAAQMQQDETSKLAAMDTDVKGQLATKASNDDVKVVTGQVGEVRTDLDSTKKDLQMARSEMGTLIAKNHSEIEELRRMGERDYVEFTVNEKNKPQAVGAITIELRGTNPKKNQYNVALVVDDKRTEERNQLVNQPIFFYAHGSKQPMEVVVNQIQKNKITGYLSMPKPGGQMAESGGSK
jgi:hypothetical protein